MIGGLAEYGPEAYSKRRAGVAGRWLAVGVWDVNVMGEEDVCMCMNDSMYIS